MISDPGNHSFNYIFCSLSLFLPLSLFLSHSLTLPPFPPFRSISSWLRFMARRLSLCHPPYGFLSPSLCVKQWKRDFSARAFFPLLFICSALLSLSLSLSLSSPPFSPSSLTSSRNSSLIQALAVCVQYVCVCVCAGSCVLYKTAS